MFRFPESCQGEVKVKFQRQVILCRICKVKDSEAVPLLLVAPGRMKISKGAAVGVEVVLNVGGRIFVKKYLWRELLFKVLPTP